jgi:serine/threonine protein kinase
VELFTPAYIGAGAFKEAYRVVDARGGPFALKIFDPSKCDIARAEREIISMRRCSSPYIGKFIDSGVSVFNGMSYLYVLEEFFDGGTLKDRLLSGCVLPLQTVIGYSKCLLGAVNHIKSLLLVHRDIKPENIMFRCGDETATLVDFGLVRDLSGESLTLSFLPHGPGTPFFASPEQLNNDKHLIDWRSDQFSVGVVLGLCLYGIHPYQEDGESSGSVVTNVLNRKGFSTFFRSKADENIFQLVKKMTAPWPICRFSDPSVIVTVLESIEKGC